MNILNLLEKAQIDPFQAGLTAFHILLIAILSFIVYGLIVRFLNRLETRLFESKMKSHRPSQAQRVKTVIGLIRQVCTVCITLFAVISILDEMSIDVRPVLAGAGVIGLAVGFGAQSLVKDFFNGLCMILENQITVGDWVTIDGKSGRVETLNFRITSLRDLDGTVHVFPNGTIGTISNSTHEWSAAVLDLPAPRGIGLDESVSSFLELGKELTDDEVWGPKILEGPTFMGVQTFGESGAVARVFFKTTPGDQWALGREYRKRLVALWEKNSVPIPATVRTIISMEQESALKKASNS